METTKDGSVCYSVKDYFRLVEEGVLSPDERVELLEGVVVAMSPQNPAHAATVWHITSMLTLMLDGRAAVRCQLPLIAGDWSAPEPDIAVVPLREDGWQFEHPNRCLIAIEVSDSTLMQDRLSKSRIYAAAGVEHFWIANLRSRQVEWYAAPDREERLYGKRGVASGEDVLPATSLALALTAEALFPPRA